MPPRLPLRPLASLLTLSTQPATASSSIPTFLLPFLVTQTRAASILSSLSNIRSSYGTPIRVGRGPSSRKGGKSGRGHKGQKQKGKAPANFGGGQTPDDIVHGKFGFSNNVHGVEMTAVNLDKLQEWINLGRINPQRPITLRELCRTKVIGRVKDGVKLLARGSEMLTSPVHIVVSRASKSAIAAVEALGGSVITRFYTPTAIRRIRQGSMHPFVSMKWEQDKMVGINEVMRVEGMERTEERAGAVGFEYRLPDPTSRKEMEYYRDKENRGYLSHTVKEGYSPSLFYMTEVQAEEVKQAKIEARKNKKKGTGGFSAAQNKIF